MKNLKNYLKNFSGTKTLMVIYPHPDDETMAAGGLLMLAKSLGWRTVVVTMTHGEAGQNHLKSDERKLRDIRKRELERAGVLLGVDELAIGEFGDGKLKNTKDKWVRWVEGKITEIEPGLVVTYDHSGVTGHPDHVSLSVEILKMVRGSGRKLLWSTIKPVWPYDHFIHKDVFDMLASPDFELDLGLRWIKKWVAARSHRSQHLGKSLSVPLVFFFMLFHKEWYHEVDLKREYKHKYVEFKI